MKLIEKVESVMRESFPGSSARVYPLSDGRIAGDMDWSGFERVDHLDRQVRLRKLFEAKLTPVELRRLSGFLLFSTTEAESIRREAQEPADLMI